LLIDVSSDKRRSSADSDDFVFYPPPIKPDEERQNNWTGGHPPGIEKKYGSDPINCLGSMTCEESMLLESG